MLIVWMGGEGAGEGISVQLVNHVEKLFAVFVRCEFGAGPFFIVIQAKSFFYMKHWSKQKECHMAIGKELSGQK